MLSPAMLSLFVSSHFPLTLSSACVPRLEDLAALHSSHQLTLELAVVHCSFWKAPWGLLQVQTVTVSADGTSYPAPWYCTWAFYQLQTTLKQQLIFFVCTVIPAAQFLVSCYSIVWISDIPRFTQGWLIECKYDTRSMHTNAFVHNWLIMSYITLLTCNYSMPQQFQFSHPFVLFGRAWVSPKLVVVKRNVHTPYCPL